MDRKARLTAGLDLKTWRGLEIGPLDNPVIAKTDSKIFYVDHAPTDDLREKYRPERDISKILEVDFVWGDRSLSAAVGDNAPFDYVVASHVLEHVPDPISWLDEIWSVLADNGALSLAIPDRRFMYDLARPPSTCGDWIEGYFRKHRRPSFKHIFDNFAEVIQVDAARAWAGAVDVETAAHYHSDQEALERCKCHGRDGRYIDSHCSVQTPVSFLRIVRRLSNLGLINFRVENVVPTAPNDLEFFVLLRKVPRTSSAEERNALAMSVPVLPAEVPDDPLRRIRELESEVRSLREVEKEVSDLRAEVKRVTQSRSWRLTEPLRVAKQAVNPLLEKVNAALHRP